MKELNFEVQSKCGWRSDRLSSVKAPTKFPCFVLNHNYDWNDYGWYTWYSLFYFKTREKGILIGELKVLCSENPDTNKVIPTSFDRLDKNFCSLGITSDYYRTLKRLFSKEECKRILIALQDCSIQIEHYERFKDKPGFKSSLCRDLVSERAWREAKYIINDMPLSEAYDIKFLFHPKYNTELSVPFKLKFDPDAMSLCRCSSIIGENGVGKTTMLGQLIDTLINEKTENIQGNFPLFSCVMAICTTPFDCFSHIVQKTDSPSLFPYYYFCANQNKEQAIDVIKKSVMAIRERKRNNEELFEVYDKIIEKEIPEVKGYEWWYYEVDENDNQKFIIDDNCLHDMLECFSSGQLQLFMLITFLFSKITYDSLLIIDEPEVHLHPRAIKDLFKLLIYFLGLFQSYCIVSTHSPLVVREMLGKFVYLMRRDDKALMLGKIGFETLGEDISVLYDEIFGYEEDTTYLGKKIVKLKAKGNNYRDIVRYFKENTQNLSLNARMLIKQIVDNE